ncbi:unnamed protein product [Phyllotreta striolata]|uniref:CLIP domain-containing serine protease n=1 Tax=Phyllotreta striolata TaxID=444603 RepID=A0A9N9TSC8_PHYSR|nr:unnamed protein product [Phyllotreta striolata]
MYYFQRVILTFGCLIVVIQCDDFEYDCMTPNMEHGWCVEAKYCKPMVKVLTSLQYPVSQNLRDELNKYVCSSNEVIYVCCTSNPIVLQARNSNDEQNQDYHRKCKTPAGADGSCINLNSCQQILEAMKSLKRPVSPSLSQQIMKYKCGIENGGVKVCCPDEPVTFNDGGSASVTPDVSRHRNLRLLPDTCGYNNVGNDKIVNGRNAQLNEFPWMALLGYSSYRGTVYKCGGTIINDRHILTAAHCIKSPQNPYTVRVGEYNLATRNDCVTLLNGKVKCSPRVQNLAVEQSIIHPEYNNRTITNDIALIRVQKISINIENIRPICLPLDNLRNSIPEYLIATGWGVSDTRLGRSSEILQKVSMPVVDLRTCTNNYRLARRVRLSEKQICAGGRNNRDTCRGDSGGPLQQIRFYNGQARFIQYGVVSIGPRECGEDEKPSVNTNVAYYMDWILDTLIP